MIDLRVALDQFYLPSRPGISRRTAQKLHHDISRWMRIVGGIPADQITTQTFNKFRAGCLEHGLKPVSIETTIQSVLSILRLLGPEQERRQGLGLIKKVPFAGQQLRRVMRLHPVPSVDHLRQVFRATDQMTWPRTANVFPPLFWKAWIGTVFVTGIRFRDFIEAERKQLSGDLLTVTARKTGITHCFPLPDWLMPLLYQLPTYKTRLFPCPLRPTEFRMNLRQLSNAAGVPWTTPQAIRRASITEWSAINSDCGAVIHGSGLGIRRHYIDPVRLLRKHVNSLPDLSLLHSADVLPPI